MLACIIEVESACWRDGMIEGLTHGHTLAAEEDLRGSDLLRAIVRWFNQLTPAAYRTYVGAYLHQKDLYGISPKMLSFWQWRTLASDLDEIVQVAKLLECEPGLRGEETRSALLLDSINGAMAAGCAPYQSLLDHGGPNDDAPHYVDGLVDAYNLCWQLLYDWSLDGDEYCSQILKYLNTFWPDDYKLYRCRHDTMCQPAPTVPAAPCCPPLEYGRWSALVDELAKEIDRCTATGAALSRRGVELSRRLLWRVDEPAPSRGWTLPPKLQQELSY